MVSMTRLTSNHHCAHQDRDRPCPADCWFAFCHCAKIAEEDLCTMYFSVSGSGVTTLSGFMINTLRESVTSHNALSQKKHAAVPSPEDLVEGVWWGFPLLAVLSLSCLQCPVGKPALISFDQHSFSGDLSFISFIWKADWQWEGGRKERGRKDRHREISGLFPQCLQQPVLGQARGAWSSLHLRHSGAWAITLAGAEWVAEKLRLVWALRWTPATRQNAYDIFSCCYND